MLLVLAHAHDVQARALVERWQTENAHLMTASDLSAPGWQHGTGGQGAEYAVLGGKRIETRAIRGLLTRISCIQETDLPHIASEDRAYVAMEMTAFLKSWLRSLPCPVLNRPTASSLLGPSSTDERWKILAARSGLTLRDCRPTSGADELEPRAVLVTVVGKRWLGPVDSRLGERAVELAACAGVELLTARFDGSGPDAAFLSAELTFDVANPLVADTVLETLQHRGCA